jgi:hypothetical protein
MHYRVKFVRDRDGLKNRAGKLTRMPEFRKVQGVS